MNCSTSRRWLVLLGLFAFTMGRSAVAADPPSSKSAVDPKLFQQTVDKAVAYLHKTQKDDGTIGSQKTPAVAALCATGLLRLGRTADDPFVAKALAYIAKNAREDGGIYEEGSTHQNYETCLAIMCLKEAGPPAKFKDMLAKAEAYARKAQWDADEKSDPSQPTFGGAGYGRSARPDLSNTAFLLDALKTMGAGPDDPAVKNALIFVSRCQNMESEYNALPFAGKLNDGGFYYTSASGGASMAAKAADQPEGSLRSYGSMTYAGLKSMLYAGVGPDDKRVKAAVEWLKKNYDLKNNPGMGGEGLYYYYQSAAKALDALGQAQFVDAKGVSHDWRKEMVEELASRQKDDGSWVNTVNRFQENDASLVTGYVLMTLSYCKPQTVSTKTSAVDPQSYQNTVDKAIAFLQKNQNADGSFGAQKMPAVAAIAVSGLLRQGRSPDDPLVAKALAFIESNVRQDGGIYPTGSRLPNYETCLCIVALADANKTGKYKSMLKNADDFVKKMQLDGGESIDAANPQFGGVGYGGSSRPDLSNTGVLMDAFKSMGDGPDDPAVKNALVFVSRCQNLESEFNTTRYAGKINDGSFYYDPSGQPDATGGLAGYGSMTYTGVKSMIYAGLKPDDKRVTAAVDWIKKNYDLKSNPGQGSAGLFYYYVTFAKALEALGQDEITDAKGATHNWRKDLVEELASRQKPDGSWVNVNRQWLEDDPSLVTSFSILALSYCKP